MKRECHTDFHKLSDYKLTIQASVYCLSEGIKRVQYEVYSEYSACVVEIKIMFIYT